MSTLAIGSGHAGTETPVRPRVLVVDLLRGLAIVLMALDHVREFLQAAQVDPLNLNETTVPLFFTRWVTHFCPSLFILLAGASIALGLNGRRSRREQARFVFVRGVWLVILELTIVHLGWQFNFHFESALGQVIWVIGWSMICMAVLLYLPAPVVTVFGLVLIFGHNAFDTIHADRFGKYAWVWQFLHDRGYISCGKCGIYIAYPLVPWVGVMAAGFGFGRLLRWNSPARGWVIFATGIAMIAAFAILRGKNIYGDPAPWTAQETPVKTLMAILNCQKYPPSLSYLLMTLGPMLAFWPLWERSRGPLARFLVVFGRVPLFFYAVHLFVIHGLTLAIVYAQVGLPLPGWLWGFPPGHAGENCGVNLPVLYLIWIGVVLLHYPLCRRFDRLKARYPNSVLRFM
ncbi:MAG: heparan-alpha-glucosaminide N-acetyltransferase domain-containing protein [Planctomycetaceae bacterium]